MNRRDNRVSGSLQHASQTIHNRHERIKPCTDSKIAVSAGNCLRAAANDEGDDMLPEKQHAHRQQGNCANRNHQAEPQPLF